MTPSRMRWFQSELYIQKFLNRSKTGYAESMENSYLNHYGMEAINRRWGSSSSSPSSSLSPLHVEGYGPVVPDDDTAFQVCLHRP